MRGLAALYVVLHNAYLEVADKAQFASIVDALGPARLLFDSGKLSVDVFIVLSGYVLMLTVMRSGGQIKSLADYCRRRYRRIPPLLRRSGMCQ